eukprot:scaffold14709_cov173-Skeletonema_dohrnii-CCMP3373.AAC.2
MWPMLPGFHAITSCCCYSAATAQHGCRTSQINVEAGNNRNRRDCDDDANSKCFNMVRIFVLYIFIRLAHVIFVQMLTHYVYVLHLITCLPHLTMQSVLSSHSHHSYCVVNVDVNDDNTHATDKAAMPPAVDTSTEEKEDCDDESFESLLQRAKYTLKLVRIAQQNERMQLQQQRQHHVDSTPSSPLSSPRPNPTVKTSMREAPGSSQSQLNVESETKQKQQLHYRQRREEAAEERKEQQQLEEPRTHQPVEEATASISSSEPLHENQRTAMDIFLSSPTGLNWKELVNSMRESSYSSSRRDLMNLIQTITIHKQLDGLDDDDDNSSLTLSLSSGTPQPSQSQQSLQDSQRTAMESFLSSPTGLNWDDFVKSIGKEHDGHLGSSTAKNEEETMPIHNATVDVKPSLISTRWRQRKFQQHNHNQSSPTRDRCRLPKNEVSEARRSKGEMSLERRIEHVLTLTPTATISDTAYKPAGNVGSEMILSDLMTIDEDIALTQKRH